MQLIDGFARAHPGINTHAGINGKIIGLVCGFTIAMLFVAALMVKWVVRGRRVLFECGER